MSTADCRTDDPPVDGCTCARCERQRAADARLGFRVLFGPGGKIDLRPRPVPKPKTVAAYAVHVAGPRPASRRDPAPRYPQCRVLILPDADRHTIIDCIAQALRRVDPEWTDGQQLNVTITTAGPVPTPALPLAGVVAGLIAVGLAGWRRRR